MEDRDETIRGTRSGAARGAEELRTGAESAAERVRDAMSGAAGTVAETAGEVVEGAKDRVARGAASLRSAAGEVAGGARGPLVGTAIGTLVGAIGGALGGWWAARALAADEERMPEDDEEACRMHFVSYTVRPAGMRYDEARTGYLLGYVASRNPEYRGRGYEEVEPSIRRALSPPHADAYASLRDFARYGYERGMGR